MKLKAVILQNFRCYGARTRVSIDDLTVLIGRNDVGKSSILEALEIFFNSDQVKIDPLDACVSSDSKQVRIGCVFTDLPDEVVLDETARTTLAAEHLLNADGDLEIHQVFNCDAKAPKPRYLAVAHHPMSEGAADLLSLKITELRARLAGLGASQEGVDLRSKPAIRRAIWARLEDLAPATMEIPLDKEDAKAIWDNLRAYLPTFALFKADRPSTDQDAEVQDPMKAAVAEAIRSVEAELQDIVEEVRAKATDVARRTLEMLAEMDGTLAAELSPHFTSDPRWASLFKLSLTDENQIPINKRGSGVRRLILLNFFRAQAERRQREAQAPCVIYAIEEPETSQHPRSQAILAEALCQLAGRGYCQILSTTHVPGLAGLFPVESLRYLCTGDGGARQIRQGSDDVYQCIADDLGVLPQVVGNRVRLLVCVEGPHDVDFLTRISAMLHRQDPRLPDLGSDERIALVPLGGSCLKHWVHCQYLRRLGTTEFHIYDRDTQTSPKYQAVCDQVNARGTGDKAVLTGKREIENYLHPDVVREEFGLAVSFGDWDDVPEMVAKAQHDRDPTSKPWAGLGDEKRRKLTSRAKCRLNKEAAARMTFERLADRDPSGQIQGWLRDIGGLLT